MLNWILEIRAHITFEETFTSTINRISIYCYKHRSQQSKCHVVLRPSVVYHSGHSWNTDFGPYCTKCGKQFNELSWFRSQPDLRSRPKSKLQSPPQLSKAENSTLVKSQQNAAGRKGQSSFSCSFSQSRSTGSRENRSLVLRILTSSR